MFIAMNRLMVRNGREHAFEQVWLGRETRLEDVPGFREFHLLRGPERDGCMLYASHSVWSSRAAFEAWTRSEAFRAAHRTAASVGATYEGHPLFEGFEVLQTVAGRSA